MKNPEAKTFELERFLPYRLSLLTNTVSRGVACSYRDQHGISVTEWRILAVLGRFPGLTASDLVQRTAMDKVAVSRAVKSLTARKLVKRDTDAADRRRRLLHLTPDRGRPLLDNVVPNARRYECRLLEALTPSEFEQLDTLLNKLQARAESISPSVS